MFCAPPCPLVMWSAGRCSYEMPLGNITNKGVFRVSWPKHKEYHEAPEYKPTEQGGYHREALYVNGQEFQFEELRAQAYNRRDREAPSSAPPPPRPEPPAPAVTGASASAQPHPERKRPPSPPQLPASAAAAEPPAKRPRVGPGDPPPGVDPVAPRPSEPADRRAPAAPPARAAPAPSRIPVLGDGLDDLPEDSCTSAAPLPPGPGEDTLLLLEDIEKNIDMMSSDSGLEDDLEAETRPTPTEPPPGRRGPAQPAVETPASGPGHEGRPQSSAQSPFQKPRDLPAAPAPAADAPAPHSPAAAAPGGPAPFPRGPLLARPPALYAPPGARPPPAGEARRESAAGRPSLMRTSVGENTSLIGRQVAVMFDRTQEDIPATPSLAPGPGPLTRPPAHAGAPAPLAGTGRPFPRDLTPFRASGGGGSQSVEPTQESTMFTVMDLLPHGAGPLDVLEEFSELTVPPLSESGVSSTSDSRLSGVWEREEEEEEDAAAAPPLVGRCARVPADGPVDPFAAAFREELHGLVRAAVRAHAAYRAAPAAEYHVPGLPAPPPAVRQRAQVPRTRPTLSLGDAKYEVLHRLAGDDAAPTYAVRCPNPPPADCHPPTDFPPQVEDAELGWRDLTALKVVPGGGGLWEYYVLTELRGRLPPAERRRFVLPRGPTHAYRNVTFLQLRFNPNPSLAEVQALKRSRNEGHIEEVIIFWAIEMLKALELLIGAGIVHGGIGLGAWLVRDVAVDEGHWDSWALEGAPGWQYKGLELTDFARSVDLRLFADPAAARFAGRGGPAAPCPEQLAGRPWRGHVDAAGVAACVHELLLQKPLELQQGPDGGWRQKAAIKRWYQHEVWQPVFDGLLNAPPEGPSADAVRGCRALLEGLLEKSENKANCVKMGLTRLREGLWGA